MRAVVSTHGKLPLLVFLLCAGASTTRATAEAAEPTLRIVPACRECIDGHPIPLRVDLANETSEPLVLPALSLEVTYHLEVRDGGGELLKAADCEPGCGAPLVPAFVLPPGDSLRTFVLLARRFPVWRKSELRVQATYASTDRIGTWDGEAGPSQEATGLWKGEVRSPTVTIRLSRGSTTVQVALDELPGRGPERLCVDVPDEPALLEWLEEHREARPVADFVELELTRWADWEATDEWLSERPDSALLRLGEYLRLESSSYLGSGWLARRHVTAGLLADPFFGPMVRSLEPEIGELEARDAEWAAEDGGFEPLSR